ncbi:hypothetical protein MRB53_027039 [Persea americana]|uniref:Uncharacterized protein n=1 Tax=Persea americana TaxID=3435 RepID=A0ACC2LKK8_PERAE|nr:hypothetical protein MRB53_027039 [Persea americana]|eukprot:TRINITY_DN25709_c0_g1_i1.p1 TRINITY_DN25709_c0_g1~~TRINITY_DN25709_c0_g1_i1.p1  ORF type:complete len:426 (-),score=22.91 TRINITY_DN25709_c0_g1_i1:131-1408(-)
MATKVFPFLLLLLLEILPLTECVNSGECNGRWIYIRDLPSRFNIDLLAHCSKYPIYGDFCPYITNHGLGPKTFNGSHSWYRTNPHMLELIFHRRMLEYPCITVDPARADTVFLPYYAGIDALRHLYGRDVNSSASHGLDLYRFLRSEKPEIWERNNGRDHFLVMARPAWDFSRPPAPDQPAWGTSFLQLPELVNLTALTLESRPSPWQEHAVPAPTSFHPASRRRLESWLSRVRRARRANLMMFAGSVGVGSGPNIRRVIREECEEAAAECELVDCSGGACDGDPIRYMRAMLRSRFCLQPAGDTAVRRSTFDGMVAGCIPVFFEERSAAEQFGWHVEAGEYGGLSVYVRKEEVVGRRVKVAEVLNGISREEEMRMRERVLEMVTRVTYRRHGSSVGLRSIKDAFDLAVEGSIRRIQERLNSQSF